MADRLSVKMTAFNSLSLIYFAAFSKAKSSADSIEWWPFNFHLYFAPVCGMTILAPTLLSSPELSDPSVYMAKLFLKCSSSRA